MKQINKYLAGATLALSSVFAASAPSVAQDANEKGNLPISWQKRIVNNYARILKETNKDITNRAAYMLKLVEHADKTNNTKLLDVSQAGFDEIVERYTDICEPLMIAIDDVLIDEEDRLNAAEPAPRSYLDAAFNKTFDRFMYECQPPVFPTLEFPKEGPRAGSFMSDAILDRKAMNIWANDYFTIARKQARAALDRLRVVQRTSGRPYIQRFSAYTDKTIEVLQQCLDEKSKFTNMVFTPDPDLIELRRAKHKLLRVCSQQPEL